MCAQGYAHVCECARGDYKSTLSLALQEPLRFIETGPLTDLRLLTERSWLTSSRDPAVFSSLALRLHMHTTTLSLFKSGSWD